MRSILSELSRGTAPPSCSSYRFSDARRPRDAILLLGRADIALFLGRGCLGCGRERDGHVEPKLANGEDRQRAREWDDIVQHAKQQQSGQQFLAIELP